MSHIAFTDEQYTSYLLCYPMINNLYPALFDKQKPLPISPETIQLISTDPYIRYTDKELAAFFEIWQTRREYSVSVCMNQSYYGAGGDEAEPIPLEVICDRARHVAVIAVNFDMSNNPRGRGRKRK